MNSEKIDYFKVLDEAHFNLYQELKFEKLGFIETDKKTSRTINSLAKTKLFDWGIQDKIYLAHVTTRENEIIEKSKLMCSSGCLVGSVFCFPAYRNNETEYSVHNLGKYIFQKEASLFSENDYDPKILLIEISDPKNVSKKITGLNYLKLGNFHFNVYEELKFLLNKKERKEIDAIVLDMIENSKELIYSLNNFSKDSVINEFENFYNLYINTILKVPIFGYFLFEMISEFIVYNQNDEKSKKYSKMNEVYVGNFKDLMFKTMPGLTRDFNLGVFTPDFELLKKQINSLSLDFNKFKEFMADSSILYIKEYLFNGEIKQDFFLKNNDLNEYNNICPHFVGHILHRIIRKMNRYPDFHINFDTYKAIKIWNYWNKHEILIPFNNIMMKGEVGINPVASGLDYKIFKTKIIKNTDDNLTFIKDDEINVKITPQLVELNKLMMRKKV